jgi:hypothetical protein
MRMRIWKLVSLPALLSILSGLVAAAPPQVTEVPRPEAGKVTEVKVAAGCLVVVAAEPASEWQLLDEADGADLRSFENGKYAAFAAPAARRYRATVTGPDKSRAVVVFVVGNPPPGPGPKPPEPKPADPLQQKLQAAFDADPAPEPGKYLDAGGRDLFPQADAAERKKAARRALAELYRQTVATCRKASVATPEDLVAIAASSAAQMVGPTSRERPGALAGVRGLVAEELAGLLPTNDPLTADQRERTAELFRKAAEALDGF